MVSARYGRQTSRLSETIRLVGYVLGGEAGARLSKRLGMATSSDTVLRRLKVGPSIEVRGARAVGVDDWAWRKGQCYGTILVDLESHTPIDLLPDRSADSLAAWLQAHPGAEVISRDRGGIYADGATCGAPEAVQVADRFHLLCNLTSAVERVLEQKRTALAKAVVPATAEPSPPSSDSVPKAKSRSEQDREDRRQRRVDRDCGLLVCRNGRRVWDDRCLIEIGHDISPGFPRPHAGPEQQNSILIEPSSSGPGKLNAILYVAFEDVMLLLIVTLRCGKSAPYA